MIEDSMNMPKQQVIYTISELARTIPMSIVLWVMLWAAIDSGPWYWRHPVGFWQHVHAVRALLPFLAMGLAFIIIFARQTQFAFTWISPLGLMGLYGLVGILATMFSTRPLGALCWGCFYLSVFVVIGLIIAKPHTLRSANQLITTNWLIIASYAFVLVFIARNELFQEGLRLSGYGIIHRIPTIIEMPMSRSSGIGRFAAIPAVIAFSRVLNGKGVFRSIWVIPLVIFTAVVIIMQSRGAVFGVAAGFCLVLILHRANLRIIFVVILVLVTALYVDEKIPDRTLEYVYRGQDRVAFFSLTGRTHTWAEGWELFKRSPFIGFGPQADRYSLYGQHIHNAYLYALVQSGILGTIPFVAAWILAWVQFIRLFRRRDVIPQQQRLLLYEAGAVFAFFTVRSIPESSAAYFGVDLLIITPLLAYFQVLYLQYRVSPLTEYRLIYMPKACTPGLWGTERRQ